MVVNMALSQILWDMLLQLNSKWFTFFFLEIVNFLSLSIDMFSIFCYDQSGVVRFSNHFLFLFGIGGWISVTANDKISFDLTLQVLCVNEIKDQS